MTSLATLNDGSTLLQMPASELVRIPVWKGNRIIDHGHVRTIAEAVGPNVRVLDFGYRLVRYTVNDGAGIPTTVTELVDGQHRHAVLREYFEPPFFGEDFQVIATVKHVESEMDIIEYFNTLNSVKSITWSDPTLIANAYICALEKAFNKPKALLIRSGETRRPYLSAEKIREELKKYTGLRGTKAEITGFVERVVAWNNARIRSADLESAFGARNAEFATRASSIGFMLAVDPKLPWIRECVRV